MRPERWAQIEQIYHAALEHEPALRATFLAEACAGDESLRRQVAGLLAYDDPEASFIEAPAIQIAARALALQPPSESQTKAETDPPVARWIGAYQLLEPLGHGGMGEVHLALDTRLGRKVAIKLLPVEFTADSSRVRRFAQEAHAASALNHPNIITIHEIGETSSDDGSRHYIVTEYVEGETLRARLTSAQQRPLKLAEALEIATQIAAALAAAHQAGIVHRDIKPENVMVRRDGIVKVLDFGLAKLTEPRIEDRGSRIAGAQLIAQPTIFDPRSSLLDPQSTAPGLVLGTPRYMSPEQARGEKVDARTDIFSLGVLLYELITGHAPFAGATTSDLIAAILKDEAPPLATHAPAAPAELERIVAQALSKNRAERYQSAHELLADLKQLQRDLEFAEEERKRSGRSSAAAKTVNKSRRAASIALTGLALAAVVVLLAQKLTSVGPRPKPAPRAESLAVLPFGADPQTEYLADGITESLINNLSRLSNLRVIARATAFSYKGKEKDPRQVGEELNVGTVLTGRVALRDDSLTVQVDLVDAATGIQKWGERYQRRLSDIFAVEEEIGRQITEKLSLRLSGEEQRQLTRRYTDNAEVYQLHLQGLYLFNKKTEAALYQAIDHFGHAVAKDPQYAPAYPALANCYLMLSAKEGPGELLPKAKAAVVKALEIDPDLAEAHSSLGHLKWVYDLDSAGAESELGQALKLNPNSAVAHYAYGRVLTDTGRFAEAHAQAKQAIELDPLSIQYRKSVPYILFLSRRYDEAIAEYRKLIVIAPEFPQAQRELGLAYEQKALYQEAFSQLQKTYEMPENYGKTMLRADLGHLYAVWGKRAEAQQVLAELLKQSEQSYVSAYDVAVIYAGLGAKEQAFAWLDKAIGQRPFWLCWVKLDPRLDGLRADPRFGDLLRRLGQAL
jgi:eukaryotic-like serine/threonine-protein kinase